MLKKLTMMVAALLLNACSTMPSGPSALVLPGTGKAYGQFQNDDQICRKLVSLQTARTFKESDYDEEESQQIYDTYYIQCMYSKGDRVPVPGDLKYDTVKDWHPPPPPNMPAPTPTTNPGSYYSPMQ